MKTHGHHAELPRQFPVIPELTTTFWTSLGTRRLLGLSPIKEPIAVNSAGPSDRLEIGHVVSGLSKTGRFCDVFEDVIKQGSESPLRLSDVHHPAITGGLFPCLAESLLGDVFPVNNTVGVEVEARADLDAAKRSTVKLPDKDTNPL